MRIFLIIVILFWVFASHSAEDIFDLAEQYNSKKNHVVDLESNRREMLAEIYNIERETKTLVVKKTELNEKKANLNFNLKSVSKKIVSLENSLKELTPKLIERIAYVEQINDLPWFYALLTSKTVTELDHLYKSAKNLNDQQYNQILKFIDLHKELQVKKNELKNTAIKLVKLRSELQSQEHKIEANQMTKSRNLQRLERKIAESRTNLEKIKTRGKAALKTSEFQDLGLLFGTSFYDKKGKLEPPVEGSLIQDYGLNESLSNDKIQLLHKGHFYQTVKPGAVKAIADGRVRFKGTVEGFGNILILDHGGHYYSLYGNLDRLNVNKNDVVAVGKTLGMTGSTNVQFSKGLYFEIRHFSEPQDPANWLVPTNEKLAAIERGHNENIN